MSFTTMNESMDSLEVPTIPREVFHQEELLKEINEYCSTHNLDFDRDGDLFTSEESDLSENEDIAEDITDDWSLSSIPRFILNDRAKQVEISDDPTEYLSAIVAANFHVSSKGNGLSFLAKHTIPLLIGMIDTFVIAPPGCGQVESFMLPLIQQISSTSCELGFERRSRRPLAIVLASAPRIFAIEKFAAEITRDMEVTVICAVSPSRLDEKLGDSKELDILITTPDGFKSMNERDPRNNGSIAVDQLMYLIVSELEDLIAVNYSRLLSNIRKEREITLAIYTHTPFPKHAKRIAKRENSKPAQNRSRIVELLEPDHAMIVVDSEAACECGIVEGNDYDRRSHLVSLLLDHKEKYEKTGQNGTYYQQSVLIFFESPDHLIFFHSFLADDIFFSLPVINLDLPNGVKNFRTGSALAGLSSRPHDLRMARTTVGKIIHFGLLPNLDSLVVNCSRINEGRSVIFLLDKDEVRKRPRRVAQLVQFLLDRSCEVPPKLMEVYNRVKEERGVRVLPSPLLLS